MEITEVPVPGYEKVVHGKDADSGLNAFIAIHSTKLGPACGGTRMLPYASEDDALNDALMLARAMTYKTAVAGCALGGGKAVIIGNPDHKTELLLRAHGRFIDSLGGKYITAEDMNISVGDLEIVRKETQWVSGISRQSGSSGNPAPLTAYGVVVGMRACAREVYGADALDGRRIAIQGVGAVGRNVARLCKDAGAEVYVADIDERRARTVAEDFDTEFLDNDDFLTCPCDILSPCARGQLFDAATGDALDCAIVAGAANNQLIAAGAADDMVARGILYAPDYVVNAGGIINISCEFLPGGYDEREAQRRIERIYDTLLKIFRMARTEGISTAEAAERLGDERLSRAS